jgi:hypothetical protein
MDNFGLRRSGCKLNVGNQVTKRNVFAAELLALVFSEFVRRRNKKLSADDCRTVCRPLTSSQTKLGASAGVERLIEVLISRDELAHACGFPVTLRYGMQRSTRTIAVLRRHDVQGRFPVGADS